MRFAVVGDPVDHSRSPAMHNAGFAALGIDATYGTLRIPDGEFGRVVEMLVDRRLAGVNVTMPHKTAAYEAVDELEDHARRAKAVNTVVAVEGRLFGANTDVEGIGHAIEVAGFDASAPMSVLGAGGAARAAVLAIAARDLTVSARDPKRAASMLRNLGVSGDVVPWGTPVEGAVVINATPIGMHGDALPSDVVDAASGLVDLAYGSAVTGSIVRARERGLPTADGIDMLIGQAMEAFRIFTGHTIDRTVFERAARHDA